MKTHTHELRMPLATALRVAMFVAGLLPACAQSSPGHAGTGGCSPSRSAVRSGDEIFAIATSALVEVALLGSERRISAHRWSANSESFEMVSSARGKPAILCKTGATFSADVEHVSSLRVRRVLTEQETQRLDTNPKVTRLRLVLDDASTLEAETFHLLIGPNGAVVAYSAELAPVEVDLGSAVLDRLATGCAKYGE